MESEYKYKIELHAHTMNSSSCGKIEAPEMVDKYKQAGYSGLVITDHFLFYPTLDGGKNFYCYEKYDEFLKQSQRGYLLAKKRADEIGFKVYYGIELRFVESINDFLVYGLTPQIMYNDDMYEVFKNSLDSFLPLKQKYGLAVFQAHPTRSRGHCYNKSFHNVDESENEQARIICEQQGKIAIGGTDAHFKNHFAIGGIIAKYLPENEAELAKMLKDKNNFIIIK